MEYHIDITVTKLVRGKGLCEQLAAGSETDQETQKEAVLVTNDEPQTAAPTLGASWMQEMIHFLQTGECPLGLDKAKRSWWTLCSKDHSLVEAIKEALTAAPTLVTRLSMLLENAASIDVQRNACAALTAIMNANLHLYIVVAESPHLMERLLYCLENHDRDKGLQTNVVAAVSVLAQRGEGLQIIKATEADAKLLSLLECTDDLRLDEEITDAICALAVHQEMRLQLVTKGAVSRLAAKLNTGSSEICVRVLLGLGMLCGSSQEAQEQLAETDGAIIKLLTLIKSSDPDIRAIAHDLFAALSSNERIKLKIEQLLRNDPVIRGR